MEIGVISMGLIGESHMTENNNLHNDEIVILMKKAGMLLYYIWLSIHNSMGIFFYLLKAEESIRCIISSCTFYLLL